MRRNSDIDTSSHTGDWIMGAARRNPEALLLVAAGAVLLMRGGSNASPRAYASSRHREPASSLYRESDNLARSASNRFSSAAESASDYASDMKDRAGSYAADIKDRVSDTASSYADTVSEFTADAGRNISETTDRYRRQVQSTLQSGMNWVLQDQPLAVALVGLAAGAAVAACFPSTDIENRALGGAREALADAARGAGENLRGAAGKAGERLKSAAAERGLSSDGLKDIASDVAETFTDAVKGKSQDQDMAGATMVPESPPVAGGFATGDATRSPTPARASEPRGRSNR